MLPTCETDYNLDRFLIAFMQHNTFYAELSRRIYKFPTKAIPTAAVMYDVRTDDIALAWNPDFFATLTNDQVHGVLEHEFNHIVFGHLSSRRKDPPKMWNVATDLAINSLILQSRGEHALPDCVLVPGRFPVKDADKLTQEQKAALPVASLIASLPRMRASEWYFEKLREVAEKTPKLQQLFKQLGMPMPGEGNPGKGKKSNQKGPGSPGGEPGEGGGDGDENEGEGTQPGDGEPQDVDLNSFDSHEFWDTVPDDMREYVEQKIKNMVEKAVRAADQSSTGWGNIPAEIRDEIRRSVSNIIPWKSVLKQFIGTLLPGGRTTSIKRINKRYPMIHPGIKRARVAKLLIAIDQSGSVGNEMLAGFFAVLTSLSRIVDIDILPFDYTADEEHLFKWKKGSTPDIKRVKCGGTSFDAFTQVVNDPKNRGRWDGVLCITDGECSAPANSRIKRGWVLGEGCKLSFATDEMQIFMDKNTETKGAWR